MGKRRSASKIFRTVLVLVMTVAMLGGLPSIAKAADKFNIGDTVEVTANLNVRTGPGTSYLEITDPDYPGYAPEGTTGIVLDGPSSADGYIWWQVNFGPGLYSGWSVEDWLEKVTLCSHSCWDRSALSGTELAALVRNHFPLGGVPQTGESIRVTAYGVAKAESGGNPSACGDPDIPYPGHLSIGLWQINTYWHPEYDRCLLFEEDYNANAAVEISGYGTDWNPWTTWKNGSYTQYLTEAREHFYPKVTSLSVSQTSINLGETVIIYYSVSDDVGLDRVELWRAVDVNGDDQPDWPSNPQDTKSVSGQSSSGYFEDSSHSSADTYWYGIHVVDNSGAPEAWNDERNSRTGGSPGVFGPIQVEVIQAGNPPQVTTEGASSITTSSAVLTGNLDSTGGETCQVWFEYGTTTSYGSSTSKLSVSSTGPFSAFLPTLNPDTTYHFRACAQNTEGTSYGLDMTFKTVKETSPPQVTTEGASSVTTSSVVLTGNLDGTGGETCQVWFEYGTTTSYGSSTSKLSVSSTGPFSAFISSLSPDTTYHFRACAQNSRGTSYGIDTPFKTEPTDQVVTFPDPNLEAAIREAIGQPTGDIYQSDLLGLTSLNAFDRDIANIAGLEHCTSLTELDLGSNRISNLEPLSGLNKLEVLSLLNNQIGDLEPLSNLTSLRYLALSSNQISTISPISNLHDLTDLLLTNNLISDIFPLSNLLNLSQLGLGANQISNLQPLSSLTKLGYLYLDNNRINSISPISNLVELKLLGLARNQISDVSPIWNLTNLQSLDLQNNYISNISSLEGLINLESLWLSDNQVSDIDALSMLTEIRILLLDDNQIANITPLSGLTKLGETELYSEREGVKIYLGLQNNQISDILPLVDNKGINEEDGMDLRGNSLSADSLNTYIPQLQARGVNVLYDVPRTWYVDDDLVDYPAADFTNIQDAVDAASSGDTIIVYPGTYTENVEVNKDHFSIQSQNGAEVTIVQAANPNDHVFELTSNYIAISGFTVKGATAYSKAGIYLQNADHCNISENIASNNALGIYSYSSCDNDLSNNNASNNNIGIGLYYSSSNNALINNTVNSSNTMGIYLYSSGNNNLINNTMCGNSHNFGIDGVELLDYIQNIDTSNEVDGSPIYYWISHQDQQIPSDAGYVGIIDCTNIVVEGLILRNNHQGVLLAYSSNSRIENIEVLNNDWGIRLDSSDNNTLTKITASNNGYDLRFDSSSNNIIYLNNFYWRACSYNSDNIWNSPEEITYTYNGNTYTSYLGNYWGWDYTGTDANGDGVGDTPHSMVVCDGVIDNYPLVEPFENYGIDAVPTEEWSFAIITDLHIGRGYPDYGGEGWEDSGTPGEDYYLTDRLERVVQTVIDTKDVYDIRFVVVLGDIADSAEYSEFDKAKTILDRLDGAGIPYVPVIGNHDVWPYTEQSEADYPMSDYYFRDVFIKQRLSLLNSFFQNWDSPVIPQEVTWYDPAILGQRTWTALLQNYAFTYDSVNFISLDFVAREPTPLGPGVGSDAVLWDETSAWLADHLCDGAPTFLFSHHPLTENPADAFSFVELLMIEGAIINSGSAVLADFAGHIHGFDPYIFMNANKEYLLDSTLDIPVVTTEAIMVGSNEPAGKGAIRIVKMRGTEIEDYNILEGEVAARAVNPYLYAEPHDVDPSYLALNWDKVMQGEVPVDLEVYAFTKRVSHDYPLHYNLDFGDGTSESWLVYEWWSSPPIETHWYDGSPGKSYDATLTVTGFTPEGESVQESLTKTITPSQWLVVGVACPVDVILTDPDGLIISKQLNEIPGADYMEYDLNGDGDADDLIVIPDRKIGDYLISITPAPDASPTDTYSLIVSVAGQSVAIAENMQVSNIPTQPYILRSTETDTTPIIPAAVDFDPDTLNVKSKDKYVTAYVELPAGFDVRQIDISSIRLNGTVPALTKPTKIGDYDKDRVPDLMVKFDASAVKSLLTPGGQVEITITGEVTGMGFQGSDTIRVIGGDNMANLPGWLRWFLLWLFGWR